MIEPKIIVRCHPARADFHRYLADRLPNDAEFAVDADVRGHRWNFLRAMGMAGNGASLHMEDDAILAECFWPRILAAINEHPDSVIQFFSRRSDDIRIGSRWDYGRCFLGAVCFYMPAGYSAALIEHWPHWTDKDKHFDAVDLFVADFLKVRKEKYWIHIPSLVDHRQAVSVVDPRRSRFRQATLFAGEGK